MGEKKSYSDRFVKIQMDNDNNHASNYLVTIIKLVDSSIE